MLQCAAPHKWRIPPLPSGEIVQTSYRGRQAGGHRSYLGAGIAAASFLAAAAIVVQRRVRKAEHEHPPAGRFIDVEGVRLHYVERGKGQPLVLLHGNGSMIQDFETSGLLALAAERYRVIVFDRPGYGYSERPRSTVWTPAAQADLLHAALAQLGVPQAIVLGHSWGASVAIALALKHPATVAALVLASGYYFPTLRADVALMSVPGIPILGDLLRYTISPLLGNLMWPGMLRKIFGPAPVPPRFAQFPVGLALRPGQLRASGAESAMMIPDAIALQTHYSELKMPVVIVAGEDDKLVTTDRQSARLHQEIAHSTFHSFPGIGHMIHHSDPHSVLAAVDEAARAVAPSSSTAPRARLEAVAA
jgi:pimeloyl-ACP methyl ester carboxylesterase